MLRTRLLDVCPKTTVYNYSRPNGVVEHREDSVRRLVANHLLRDEVCGPRCARAVFSRARPQARWRWAQQSRLRLHEGNVVATNIITAQRNAPYCRGRSAPAVLDRIRRSSWTGRQVARAGICRETVCYWVAISATPELKLLLTVATGCLPQFLTVPRSRVKLPSISATEFHIHPGAPHAPAASVCPAPLSQGLRLQ